MSILAAKDKAVVNLKEISLEKVAVAGLFVNDTECTMGPIEI